MSKKIAMVVGLETDTAQLSLEMIGGDLPAVVLSDEQVTAMHHSFIAHDIEPL
jgi:hypothetical protein